MNEKFIHQEPIQNINASSDNKSFKNEEETSELKQKKPKKDKYKELEKSIELAQLEKKMIEKMRAGKYKEVINIFLESEELVLELDPESQRLLFKTYIKEALRRMGVSEEKIDSFNV